MQFDLEAIKTLRFTSDDGDVSTMELTVDGQFDHVVDVEWHGSQLTIRVCVGSCDHKLSSVEDG